jgi:hypothetical protein
LDNARTICQLLSNLGSGAINVPRIQAAGQVGVQIIDIIKVSRLEFVVNVPQKTKGNMADYDDLVTRIVQLLAPVLQHQRNHQSTTTNNNNNKKSHIINLFARLKHALNIIMVQKPCLAVLVILRRGGLLFRSGQAGG